jgi:hypothetical protein
MKVYTIQINYQTGISVTSEFESFSVEGGVWKWIAYGDKTPIILGVNCTYYQSKNQ